MAESFVATLKRELVKGRVFASRFEAEISVVEYLGWFNHTRLHGELGDVPPAEFEALWPLGDTNASGLRSPPQLSSAPTPVAGLYDNTDRPTHHLEQFKTRQPSLYASRGTSIARLVGMRRSA